MTSSAPSGMMKRDNSGALFSGKVRYKFWALAALAVLAVWSLLTGTVNLKWSAGNLTLFSDDASSSLRNDLDILEVEERKKAVRKMWNVYTHNKFVRLPKFWVEAFEAGYEYLVSEDSGVRDAAVLEIAKMSLMSFDDPDSPSLPSKTGERIKEQKKITPKETTKAVKS